MVGCFQTGGKLLLFGNGGSAADAQHVAGELSGRYLFDRHALPAMALADSIAAVTAIGNDYGFDARVRAPAPRLRAAAATSPSASRPAAARRTCWPGCGRRASWACSRLR